MTENVDLDSFRTKARAWAAANLEPRTDTGGHSLSESRTTPEDMAACRALQRKIFDAGFAGISYPKEYGGQGLTGDHERVWKEETGSYELPEFGGLNIVMFGAIGRSLLAHCTPEFLKQRIPKLLSGDEIWCQFYSEPDAGSDLAGIRTRATRDGDKWVLKGAKVWSTAAEHADWAMCLARTDWDVPKHRGLTWFAMPTDAEGLEVRPITMIAGATGFCEEFIDDVVVTDDRVIGEINQGWTVAQTMLVYERGGGDFNTAPVAPKELAPDLVELAKANDRLEDPMVRQAIARAHTNDFALYQLGKRLTRRLAASSTPDPSIAAYGKLGSGTYQPIRAKLALEIAGASELTWEVGAEPSETAVDFLNGRATAIAAGSNEMQRNGIAERVLGLPREPSFDSGKPFSDVLRDAVNWNGKVS